MKTKNIVCLVGLPATGKTTQAKILAQIGFKYWHVAKFAEKTMPQEIVETARKYGKLIPGVDENFLGSLRQDGGLNHVLDGFPRSAESAKLLKSYALNHGWNVTLIYLKSSIYFAVVTSIFRQILRDCQQIKLRPIRYVGKILRSFHHDLKAIKTAEDIGLKVANIASSQRIKEVENLIRISIGLDFDSTAWDKEALSVLAEVDPNALVVGGHFYSPFFSGIFGPLQQAFDIDVRVWGKEKEREVATKLKSLSPSRRWQVKDALSWSQQMLGRDIKNLGDVVSIDSLVCLCGGVRMKNNCIEVVFGHPEAEKDLRNGVLRLNTDGALNLAKAKAKKLVKKFPGLSAPFVNHSPEKILYDWNEIKNLVLTLEHGGKRQWSGLSQNALHFTNAVREFHKLNPPEFIAVPQNNPATLPSSNPWQAPDKEFREWILDQTRRRKPISGYKDPYLIEALKVQIGVCQKPTHQGWELDQHATQALLVLETDNLPGYCYLLRLATLWHDLGKTINVNTPGAHGLIGAKLWLKFKPNCISEKETKIISLLIANHDVFGRLDRGIMEPEFRGAVDGKYIVTELQKSPIGFKETLSLLKEVWKADVGSIPILRWLSPLADKLEEIILAETN